MSRISQSSRLYESTYGFIIIAAILLFSTFILTDTSLAQTKLKDVVGEKAPEETEEKPKPPAVKPVGPEDDFERGVPRSSVKGFLDAARKGDYERAAQYLDLRNLPARMGRNPGSTLAKQLKVVLDRALWVDLDLLSDDPKGHSDDGLPPYRDLLGQIETPKN